MSAVGPRYREIERPAPSCGITFAAVADPESRTVAAFCTVVDELIIANG